MFAATAAMLLLGQLSAEPRMSVVVSRGIGVSDDGARFGEGVAAGLREEGLIGVEGPKDAAARLPGLIEKVKACERAAPCLAAQGRALSVPVLLSVDVAVLGDRASLKVQAHSTADGAVLEGESGTLAADADEAALADWLAAFALRLRKRLDTPAATPAPAAALAPPPAGHGRSLAGAAVGVAGLGGGAALLASARSDFATNDPSAERRARLKTGLGVGSLLVGAAGAATAIVFWPRATDEGPALSLQPTGLGLALSGRFP